MNYLLFILIEIAFSCNKEIKYLHKSTQLDLDSDSQSCTIKITRSKYSIIFVNMLFIEMSSNFVVFSTIKALSQNELDTQYPNLNVLTENTDAVQSRRSLIIMGKTFPIFIQTNNGKKLKDLVINITPYQDEDSLMKNESAVMSVVDYRSIRRCEDNKCWCDYLDGIIFLGNSCSIKAIEFRFYEIDTQQIKFTPIQYFYVNLSKFDNITEIEITIQNRESSNLQINQVDENLINNEYNFHYLKQNETLFIKITYDQLIKFQTYVVFKAMIYRDVAYQFQINFTITINDVIYRNNQPSLKEKKAQKKLKLKQEKNKLKQQKYWLEEEKKFINDEMQKLKKEKMNLTSQQKILAEQKQYFEEEKMNLTSQEKILKEQQHNFSEEKINLKLEKQNLKEQQHSFDEEKINLKLEKKNLKEQRHSFDEEKINLELQIKNLKEQRHSFQEEKINLKLYEKNLLEQNHSLQEEKIQIVIECIIGIVFFVLLIIIINLFCKLDKNVKLEQFELTCLICQRNLRDGKPLQYTNCNHSFHKECFENHFQLSSLCPKCKKNIEFANKSND